MLISEKFMELFQVPDFVKPYLHHFVTEQEMELIVKLKGRSLTADDIAGLMNASVYKVRDLLEKAYQREVLNREIKDGLVYYKAADFYARLDNYCKWGNYYVLPKSVRKKLDQWCYDEFLKRNNNFQKVIENDPEYDNCFNEWVLLLSEVEEMIDVAREIRVVPCDCKMLADNCDRPREVCLFFDNKITDRTGGRTLTKDEAKQLVRYTDQKGLMHTGGPYNWREVGPNVVCNCCADCCYPFRAALHLGTKGKWPKSRYIANYNPDNCRLCGRCVQRCHFGAFYYDGTVVDQKGRSRRRVAFNPDLCWGCGLCANSCPAGAIVMEKL
ncbi:MAG TPA: 4Fe-4S binding protein [Syntrophaceticus sp.]|nr:4Fe-4S binding protein [Syntrophaceticus sp.]